MSLELEKRVGKWFKPNADARKYGYISTTNSKDKILGYRGMGGQEIQGSAYAVFIEGRTYIFAGYNEQLLDENGNGLRDQKGRQGYYEYRWHEVHFEHKLEDPYQDKVFEADDLSSNDEHKKAVEIAVEFLWMRGLLNMKIPPTREIAFTKRGSGFGGDPRNPKDVIKVNTDVD